MVLSRADKRRYGNLQISLKNSYLLGGDNYPDTIPYVLIVLNTYKTEWTPSKTHPPTPPIRAPWSTWTGGRNQPYSFCNSQATEYVSFGLLKTVFSPRSHVASVESKGTTRHITWLQQLTHDMESNPTGQEREMDKEREMHLLERTKSTLWRDSKSE